MKVNHQGFTLLEILVAIAIFAIVYSIAVASFKTAVNIRDSANVQMERISAAQLAFSLLAKDIEQMIPREIRDNYGETRQALTSEFSLDSNLEFSRTGRMPQGFMGFNLTRVAYGIQDNKLIRFHWDVMDRAQNSEPHKTQLLSDLKSMEMRFMDQQSQWQSRWPVDPNKVEDKYKLPRAIEITLHLNDWGRVVRIFQVPSNG